MSVSSLTEQGTIKVPAAGAGSIRSVDVASSGAEPPSFTPNVWITATALAELAGITERKARRALERARQGKPWRDSYLITRQVKASGGPGGKRLVVRVDTLPDELQARFAGTAPKAIDWIEIGVYVFDDESAAVTFEDDSTGKPERKRRPSEKALKVDLRHAIIAPCLTTAKHSPERKAAVSAAAAQAYRDANGELQKYSEKTLYRWIAAYEDGGLTKLGRKTRYDKGQPSYIVSPKYDAACPLPDEVAREVATSAELYAKSLWRSGSKGWANVAALASTKLLELSRAAGWKDATLDVCQVSRRTVERWRHYVLAEIQETDAKLFSDKYQPRVKRDSTALKPMEVVSGDITAFDVAIRREDGRIGFARLIGWFDVATRRIFVSLILPPKGSGVRRVDVARSFASMCDAWGLPEQITIDNGSEYNWTPMLDGFSEIANLCGGLRVTYGDAHHGDDAQSSKKPVTKRKKYQPQGAAIEGVWGVLVNSIFSIIAGYVGGNRLLKRSANLGGEPPVFDGTFAELAAALETALEYYHNRPQRGALRGKSPNETYADFIAAGWGKSAIKADAIACAFATQETRIPDRGYVRWGATTYYHDDLLPFTGCRITVRVAEHDPRLAFCFDGETFICAAGIAQTFAFNDPAGAVEQGRRAKKLREYISHAFKDGERLDLVEETRRHLKHMPPRPEAPVAREITVSPATQMMVERLRQADDKRLHADEPNRAARPIAQWVPADHRDPLLESLTYLPDDQDEPNEDE